MSRDTVQPALEAVDVQKSYPLGSARVQALRSVTFSLRPGEVVGLTGPSGSGKTTLLNVACGWERPDEGSMTFRGDRVASPGELGWADVAIVPQDLALLEELTIGENVRLPLRLGGARLGSAADVGAVLEALGIDTPSARLPAEASLGEQQRAALARAVVVAPSVLLADEPTAHQDEEWTKAVMRTIRAVATANGTACLVATHDPDAVEYLDRTLVMRDGELAASG